MKQSINLLWVLRKQHSAKGRDGCARARLNAPIRGKRSVAADAALDLAEVLGV